MIANWKSVVRGLLLDGALHPRTTLKLTKSALKVKQEKLEESWLLAEEPRTSRRRR